MLRLRICRRILNEAPLPLVNVLASPDSQADALGSFSYVLVVLVLFIMLIRSQARCSLQYFNLAPLVYVKGLNEPSALICSPCVFVQNMIKLGFWLVLSVFLAMWCGRT